VGRERHDAVYFERPVTTADAGANHLAESELAADERPLTTDR
jgi:hypothetical protein